MPELRPQPYNPADYYAGAALGQNQWAPPVQFPSPLSGVTIPFIGPQFNQMAKLLGGSFVAQMSQSHGSTLLGFSTQNAFDRLRGFSDQAMLLNSMQLAGGADRTRMMQFAHQVSDWRQQPWSIENAQVAASHVNTWALPVYRQFSLANPQMMDQLLGQQGSAGIFAMHAFRAMRDTVDPRTGRTGMTPQHIADLTQDVQLQLFGTETARRSTTLSMGRAGELLWALQQRGHLATPTLADLQQESPALMSSLLQKAGVNKLDDLTGRQYVSMMQSSEVSQPMRQLSARRITTQLKEWSKTVEAVQELFVGGNAPFPQLMATLDKITGGSMGQISASQAEQLVRNTANLAKAGGVSIGHALNLQAGMQPLLQANNIDPIFGAYAGNYAAATRAGYNSSGAGAYQYWGAPTQREVEATAARAYVGAVVSPMMSQLGVLSRFSEQLAGDSDAARMLQAARAGRSRFRNSAGEWVSSNMREEDFVSLMTAGQVPGSFTAGDVTEALMQREANQRAAQANPKLALAVLGSRDEELSQLVGSSYVDTWLRHANISGLSEEKRAKLIRAAGATLMATTPAMHANPALQDAAMQRALSAAAGDAMPDVSAALGGRGWTIDANLARNSVDETLAMQGHLDLAHVTAASGPAHRRAMAAMDTSARQTQLQSLLAPLGKGGPLRGAMEAIFSSKVSDKDALSKMFLGAIGGTTDARASVWGRHAGRLKTMYNEIQDVATAIEHEADPARRKRLQQELQDRTQEFISATTQIQAKANNSWQIDRAKIQEEKLGLFAGASASVYERIIDPMGFATPGAANAAAIEDSNAQELLEMYSSDREFARRHQAGAADMGVIQDATGKLRDYLKQTGLSLQEALGRGDTFVAFEVARRNAAMGRFTEDNGSSGKLRGLTQKQSTALRKFAASQGVTPGEIALQADASWLDSAIESQGDGIGDIVKKFRAGHSTTRAAYLDMQAVQQEAHRDPEETAEKSTGKRDIVIKTPSIVVQLDNEGGGTLQTKDMAT